jgi:polysaccharide biosynthesis/export protein
MATMKTRYYPWRVTLSLLALAGLAILLHSGYQTETPGQPEAPQHLVDWNQIQLCQALGPAAPHGICGVDSLSTCNECQTDCLSVGGRPRGCLRPGSQTCAPRVEASWDDTCQVDWQSFAQGEYVGHDRTAHVPEYRLRVGDLLTFLYRLTRIETSQPYELQVGDQIRVESLTGDQDSSSEGGTNDNIYRDLIIQPDGTISLPLLGQVRATRRTIQDLRNELEKQYEKYYRVPAITVTPLSVNTKLSDLLETVDARMGIGGLRFQATVTPAGKIYMPALGSIYAQGLTLEELKCEIDARYDDAIPGVEVTPLLMERAQRFVYVLGEVRQPGRFTLEGPTTLMGAIALAGGWNQGANLWQVVVFRRGDDWRLLATMLNIRGALYGHRPTPADEIWLNDSDIVVIPKTKIQVADEVINQFFTQGLYSIFPQFGNGFYNFRQFGSVAR